jgi:hypothetical protein
MIRILHPRIAAVVSAVMVVLTGSVSHGEGTMSKNFKRSRPSVPPVFTTRSGSRYVRSIDVIRSIAGRKELDRQLQNTPANGNSVKDTKKENKK